MCPEVLVPLGDVRTVAETAHQDQGLIPTRREKLGRCLRVGNTGER